MKVRDVMIKNVKFCSSGMNLAAVTEILWKAGCGALPVVENGRVVGMITDRDIAIALGTRNVKASTALVSEVALPKLFYCAAPDNIHIALQIMGAQKVRRLPVLDAEGGLQGILCLDDIAAYAEEKGVDLTYADVAETMKSICEHATVAGALAVAR